MAESIKIEIFRKKEAEDFSLALADPASRAQTGSGTAMTAAVASALLQRAARLTKEELSENERVEYIVRNSEILRKYMVNLIDEDVKARGPYRRAIKEGDPRKIEAASQSAGASMRYCVYWGDQSTEDTRRYVIRRENELQWEEIRALYQRVIEKAES